MTAAKTDPVARLGWVQVDCTDPERLGRFWADALGVGIRGTLGDPVHYVVLEAASPGAPRLSFQRVPDPTPGKNRLHLDLAVPDVEAATTALEKLGATRVPAGDISEYEIDWRILADPEGNQFCVFRAPPGDGPD
jgi:predicted enzyme related to lactoylglutathione lyase